MATDALSVEIDVGREIVVRVPRGLKAQLVFRQSRNSSFEVPSLPDSFLVVRVGPWSYVKYGKCFHRLLGLKDTIKGWLKLFTKRRTLFCATYNGALVHYTWATVGRSRYYWIENDAAVIGPIWTSPKARGRNLAVVVLQKAVNALIAQGLSIFYIDTSPSNDACLRVIAKCGFSEPVGSFLRPRTL